MRHLQHSGHRHDGALRRGRRGARAIAGRQPGQESLIVISDGGDNASVHSLAEVLKIAEQSSALVYTIGIFDDQDPDRNPRVLKRLAQATGGEAFFPGEVRSVVTACERIARDIRHQYTLGYVSSNPAETGGYRAIRVVAQVEGKPEARRAHSLRLHRHWSQRGQCQMKLKVDPKSLRLALRWTQGLLFLGAVSMLGYDGLNLIDSLMFQDRAGRRLDQLLTEHQGPNGVVRQAVSSGSLAGSPPAAADGLIGRIEIQRLGLSVIVVEGTTSTTLRRAVGHIPGTALPGQPGNVGISGHRDTFFRPLRNILQNDIITLTTLLGEFRYRVVSTRIVGPNDVAVLDPSQDEILTLVTCYPFYFVGSAPDRFIVRAERVI